MFNRKIKEQVKQHTRANLGFLDSDDDMFETLFKYYETLKN